METVHVQLANEGRIVVVLEQLGDERFREFILVEDDERITIVGPADEISIPAIFEKAVYSQRCLFHFYL